MWHTVRHFLLVASTACFLMAGDLDAQPAPQTSKPVAVKFDEFKYDSNEDTKARLAPLAKALKNQPRARAFIIAYVDRLFRYGDSSAGSMGAYTRIDLVYRREDAIEWDRVVIVDGGYREENMIEVYLVPPGAPAPTPRPTLQPAEVTFCPLITVSAPLYVWDTKRSLRFSAWVREEMTKTVPTYRWTVSSGQISSGQATDEIVVQQTGAEYQPVTATFEIGGYSSECEFRVSAASPKNLISIPFKMDEFGYVASGDMKARLDNYAFSLQVTPEMQAYILFYGGRRYSGRLGRRNEAELIASRLKHYLLDTRGLAPDRLLMINGGLREEWTAELWLSPRGAKVPTSTPTVPPNEIRFLTGRRTTRR